MTDICKHCGKTRAEHHAWERKVPTRPKGCVCDATEWMVDPIGPVCASYRRMSDEEDICCDCEHDRLCHKGEK
jgi:hypothetical protein